MNLLPCAGRGMPRNLIMAKHFSTELSTFDPVYPGVERLGLKFDEEQPHVE